jgi:hypothetical protein
MKGDKKVGPFSGKAIAQFAASGKLSRFDRVQKKGSTTWHEAGAVKGLFPPETVLPAVVAENGEIAEDAGDSFSDNQTFPTATRSETAGASDRLSAVDLRSTDESGDRIFKKYYAVEFIRGLWIVSVVLASLMIVAIVFSTIYSTVDLKTDRIPAIGTGIGLCLAVALALVTVRVALETVAVFFEILHEVQRISRRDVG